MSAPNAGSAAVIRTADWAVGLERDDEGRAWAPTREVQCTTCEESSDPSPDQTETDQWAIQHTEVTGHRSYHEIVTTGLIVSPAPTSPLYEHQAER